MILDLKPMIPIQELRRPSPSKRKKMKIIAIAAVAINGIIGKGSELPWNIPEDLKFFRDSTRDQVVLMGRKTYQALGKALPKRKNGIITRDLKFTANDADVFQSIEKGIEYYQNQSELSGKILFIIGGAEIYNVSRAFLDELWLTEINEEVEGDVYFPQYHSGNLAWSEFRREKLGDQNDFVSSSFHYQFSRFLKEV